MERFVYFDKFLKQKYDYSIDSGVSTNIINNNGPYIG